MRLARTNFSWRRAKLRSPMRFVIAGRAGHYRHCRSPAPRITRSFPKRQKSSLSAPDQSPPPRALSAPLHWRRIAHAPGGSIPSLALQRGEIRGALLCRGGINGDTKSRLGREGALSMALRMCVIHAERERALGVLMVQPELCGGHFNFWAKEPFSG